MIKITDKLLNIIVIQAILPIIAFAWEDDPNRYPTKCETCKYLAIELDAWLKKLDSNEVMETNYNLNDEKFKRSSKRYRESEVRLIEATSNACRNLLEYHVHANRPGSLRFSRDEHPTINAFKKMKQEGAKVEIGIPGEHDQGDMWDIPSVEIMRLKRQCDTMIELYEEDIEDWYFHHRKVDFTKFFCEGIILKREDKTCLREKVSNYKRTEL